MSKKLLMVHIPKTGGTSIRKGVSKAGASIIPAKFVHMPLFQLQKEGFDHSFGFVRNPWDRWVSVYFFYKNNPEPLNKDIKAHMLRSFDKFVKNLCSDNPQKWLTGAFSPENLRNQFDWVCDHNGEIAVDFLGRFEKLQEDFNIMMKQFGLKQVQLPFERRGIGRKPDYREHYNDETKELIANFSHKDIEHFGYTF